MANENVSLIKHQIERFGAVTVMDVTLYDYSSKTPILELDTLKISNITTEGQSKDIRGGLKADLLLQYDFGRSANVEIQDALLSMHSLARFWGATMNQDNIESHERIAIDEPTAGFTAGATIGFDTAGATGAAINLADKNYQLLKTDLHVYERATGRKLAETTDYTVEMNAAGTYVSAIELVTKPSSSLLIYGVNVISKAVNANGYNPAEVVMKSTSFPQLVKLVGKTVFIEESTGKEILSEIEIPKFKINPSFSFSMDAEGAASVFDCNGAALANGASKDLVKVKTLSYVSGVLS